MLIALPILLAGVGCLLVWRGHVGTRRGDEPRCRRCDYDLRGQIEPRCPECGTPFSEATVRRGRYQRRPRRIVTGWLFILLATTLMLPPVQQYLSTTLGLPAWQRRIALEWSRRHVYLPNFILIYGQSGDPSTAWATVSVLRQRMVNGYLSRGELAKVAGPLIAASRAGGQLRSDRAVGEMITELLAANVMSGRDAQRYIGIWGAPAYRPPREDTGSLPVITQKFSLAHTRGGFPQFLPLTEVWLLQVDGSYHTPCLLDSQGSWEASHLVPWDGVPEEELTIRVSTTWYRFEDAVPIDERHAGPQLRAAMEELRPRMLCRLVKDVRFTSSAQPGPNRYHEHRPATILAEGEDPATMPAP